MPCMGIEESQVAWMHFVKDDGWEPSAYPQLPARPPMRPNAPPEMKAPERVPGRDRLSENANVFRIYIRLTSLLGRLLFHQFLAPHVGRLALAELRFATALWANGDVATGSSQCQSQGATP